MKNQNNSFANFLFEASTLKRLKRTGWQILGGNDESIAEHSYMVAVIGYILAVKGKADIEKVLTMALFHDFTETRTGDICKLADLYIKVDEDKAINDTFTDLLVGKKIIKILAEYRQKKSLEGKIVHDADILALCLELKQLIEKGNQHALEWFRANKERLYLDEAKKLLREIEKTDSQNWWKKEREKLHQLMKG